MSWRPILDGAERARALAAVDEVAAALANPGAVDASLADGAAGEALLFAYLAVARKDDAMAERADDRLGVAIDKVAEEDSVAHLYGGFVGVAWVAEALARLGPARDPDDPAEDPNEEIDAPLGEHLELTPWSGHFDLVGGLAGLGAYALERVPRRSGVALLERVVARLDELATRTADGAAWFTSPAQLTVRQRASSPEGHYDLGLAHGAPGPIAILAGACLAGVAVDRARPLVERGARWLIAQRVEGGLPYRVGDSAPARCAWCYGDAGAATAMWAAGRALGERELCDEAVAMARRVAQRTFEQSGVADAGLCHGAVGVAHLLSRIGQAADAPDLIDAARAWFGRALAMRGDGGVGGFFAVDADGNRRAARGFLTGAAGVALGLASAAYEAPPFWDRALAVSVAGVD